MTKGDYFADLLKKLQVHEGGPAALRALEEASLKHPGDARILLLLGAERMQRRDVDGAEAAFVSALQIAPQLHIARFQLGLLQLTGGRPAAALATWAPLDQLDAGDPLRLFKQGLEQVARGEFEDARRFLLEGIARNRDNPPLNHDMRMVLDRIVPGRGEPHVTGNREEDQAAPASAHFLVSSYRKP